MFDLKTKWNAWREKRFLKRHGCTTREEYDQHYDKDVCKYSNQVENYYQGYPYIHAFVSSHKTPFDQFGDWLEGLTVLRDWCRVTCKKKWRTDMLRVRLDSGNLWVMDEMGGGDVVFFAFKSEQDLLWFRLRWV